MVNEVLGVVRIFKDLLACSRGLKGAPSSPGIISVLIGWWDLIQDCLVLLTLE